MKPLTPAFHHAIRLMLAFIVILGLMVFSLAQPAGAATVTVMNTNDSGAGSLRQAVLDAFPTDTITFDASLAGGTITLLSEIVLDKWLTIDGAGLSPPVQISGGGSVRVFTVDPGGTIYIRHVDITDGTAVFGAGIYSQGTLNISNCNLSGHIVTNIGGAIANSGTLTITDSTIADNSAGLHGGAIFNSASLTVSGTTFTGNVALGGGGGVISASSSSNTISNSTFYDNSATTDGAGIYNIGGTLTVNNSTFSDNTITGSGGGIYNSIGTLDLKNTILANSTGGSDCYSSNTSGSRVNNLIENGTCGSALTSDPQLLSLADNGGPTETMEIESGSPAINAGNHATCESTDQRGFPRPQGVACDIGAFEVVLALTVNSLDDPGIGSCDGSECTLRGAVSVMGMGGTIDFDPALAGGIITLGSEINLDKDLTLDGSSTSPNVGVSGGGAARVFNISNGVTVSIDHLDIIDGSADNGGGIYNMGTLEVSNSALRDHSAINGGGIYNMGTLEVSNSTLRDHSATNLGGGIYHGGANLTIENSSFSGNHAAAGGGGVYISGESFSVSTLSKSTFQGNSTAGDGGGVYVNSWVTISNSTFQGNNASSDGGGVFAQSAVTVSNSTFYENGATTNGGGVYSSASLSVVNSILAGSTSGTDCYNDGGTITSMLNSLIEDGNCGSTLTEDPRLLPLDNNGGPTQTMLLGMGSPALNAGDDGSCETVDQRGVPRPEGAHCDIGAVEMRYLTVNSLNDPGTGVCDLSECTLREAITEHENGGIIIFDPALAGGTITLGSQLTLAQGVLIDGSGLLPKIRVSGDGSQRVFQVNDRVTAFIYRLEISDGSVLESDGGGILNEGTLTISECTLSGNNANLGDGGGINNRGTLTIADSTLSGNSSSNGGGGINNIGTLMVSNSTFSSNSATNFGGGILNNRGALTVSNSTFYGNTASTSGGGIRNNIGTLHLTNTIVAGSPGGGDCSSTSRLSANINNLVEDGTCSPALTGDPQLLPLADNGGLAHTMALQAGSPAIDAGDASTCEWRDQRGLSRHLHGAACDIGAYEYAVQIRVGQYGDAVDGRCDSYCTLREAIAAVSSGGTILFGPNLAGLTTSLIQTINVDKDLTIDGSELSPHIQVSGGGSVLVFDIASSATVNLIALGINYGNGLVTGGIENRGSLTLTNCSFIGNVGGGGAITNTGDLTVQACTFTNNAAANGAGILNQGTLTVRNSTFYNNYSYERGGGIHNQGILTVSNSTFSENTGSYDGDGIYNAAGAILHLTNSILANETTGEDCINDGTLATNINNLIERGNCSPAVTDDPQLGPLTDNGGSTATMALGPGSPARDAGDDGTCEVVDQRGVARPQGSHCDIGAFEFFEPVVNSLNDPGDGTCNLSECTLREAVSIVQAGGVITFDPALAGGAIRISGEAISIERDMTIDGSGLTSHIQVSDAPEAALISLADLDVVINHLDIIDCYQGLFIYPPNETPGLHVVSQSTFSGNGEGIRNRGELSILETTFAGNREALDNDHIVNISESTFIENTARAITNDYELTLSNSTFTNNSSELNGGAIWNNGSLNVANSTFVGNNVASAYMNRSGGAIYNHALADISNSTFDGNSAEAYGAGIFNSGTLHLTNTILAGSTSGEDCYNDGGTFATNTNNLIEDGTCSPALAGDPLLLPLADNGGSTLTMALIPGSPALEAGDNASCESTDQRGITRPQGVHCDIGAFELQQLIVNSLDDPGIGVCDASECTLREAVSEIESGGIILFDPSLVGGVIMLGSEIVLDKDLTIDGSGLSPYIQVSGGGSVRVFALTGGASVEIDQLDITDGLAISGGGIDNTGSTLMISNCNFDSNHADDGAAINNNNADLTITNCTFSNNHGVNYGGAINNLLGSVTITNSTFSTNTTDQYGGALFNNEGVVTLANSTLANNSAVAGGGIINNLGTLTLSNSTLFGNSASLESGGIGNAPGSTLHLMNTIIAGSPSGGDCVNTGTLSTNTNNLIEDGSCSPAMSGNPLLGSLADNGGTTGTMALLAGSPAIEAGDNATCEVTDQRGVTRPQGVYCDIGAFEVIQPVVNSDHDPGDGICDSSECTLREAVAAVESSGSITFHAAMAGETIKLLGEIVIDKNLTIDGSSLGTHVEVGGGSSVRVFSVNGGVAAAIVHLDIVGGYASGGGGILNQGVLTLSNTLLAGNDGQSAGGGISNSASGALTVTESTFMANSAMSGGGLANAGLTTLEDCTFSGNNGQMMGGGIANDSAVVMTIRRSTFAGNTAGVFGGAIYNDTSVLTVLNSTISGNSTAGFGGGLYNESGTLTVSGSTFSGNDAGSGGGGLYNAAGALLLLKNTILADSGSGGDCSNVGILPLNLNNLIEDGTCSPALTGDPLLVSLADNGGPTETMALGSASPAIDAADDATCEAIDQRGVTRPQGAFCDIGAFELEVVYPYTLYLPLILR